MQRDARILWGVLRSKSCGASPAEAFQGFVPRCSKCFVPTSCYISREVRNGWRAGFGSLKAWRTPQQCMSPPLLLVGKLQLAVPRTAGLFFCVRPARVFLRRNALKRKRRMAFAAGGSSPGRDPSSRRTGSLIYNIGIARLPPLREPARTGARAPFHENVRCTAGGGMPRNFRRRRANKVKKGIVMAQIHPSSIVHHNYLGALP